MNELEEEFKQLCAEYSVHYNKNAELIKAKVESATKQLKEACALAEQHSIPFAYRDTFGKSAFYVPVALKEGKFMTLKEKRFDMEDFLSKITGCDLYGSGWYSSSSNC